MRNVLFLSICMGTLAVLGSCGPTKPNVVYQPPVETSYGREPDDPDKALTEQLRQGAVQMAAASDTIESALVSAKKAVKVLDGEAKQAAQDVVDLLDDAGASVADASSDPPNEAQVKKDFASADDDRKARISAGNDAYRSIETALGTLEGLESQVDGLSALKENINLALEDLSDAIEALGGKVESETEEAGK